MKSARVTLTVAELDECAIALSARLQHLDKLTATRSDTRFADYRGHAVLAYAAVRKALERLDA